MPNVVLYTTSFDGMTAVYHTYTLDSAGNPLNQDTAQAIIDSMQPAPAAMPEDQPQVVSFSGPTGYMILPAEQAPSVTSA